MPIKNDPQKKEHYKGLTFKEGRFVDELVRQATEEGNINRTKAALVAFNAKPNTARTMGSRLMSRDNIRQAFLTELDRYGLNDKLSVTTFKRIFGATKRQLDPDGNYNEVPDYPTQLRAVQEYHKVKGLYPDKKTVVTKREATLNLYADMTPEQLEEVEKELVESIKELEGKG